MPTFEYKARNWDGKIVNNEMEGESKEVCIAKLREKGTLSPASLKRRLEAAFILTFLSGESVPRRFVFLLDSLPR